VPVCCRRENGGAGNAKEEQGERTSGTDIPKEIHTRLIAEIGNGGIRNFMKYLSKHEICLVIIGKCGNAPR
jgi:hypothetical protein